MMINREELKSCPFCGSDSVKISKCDIGFIGQYDDGRKKLKYRVNVRCNKCHAKGKPITTTVIYGERGFHRQEAFQIAEQQAMIAWNTRCCQGKLNTREGQE